MDYRHREVIKKYSPTLQQSINLHDMKDSLSESKIFTAHMLKDIYDGEASFFEELPTRGPQAFFRFINLLKTNGYTTIAEELCHVANPAYQISDNHGYHHIILNYEFKGIKSSEELKELECGYKLEASALDSALLQNDFKNHKYHVNLEADKLYSKLKKFSKMDSLRGVNSCIVIILSFGTQIKDSKVIYGHNGKYILLHDILNLFSDTNCPSLKYKPKIFILPSFDVSHNVSVERVELSTDVNDTFLWYLPPLKIYKCINNVREIKFFGEILSENLRANFHKSDFETVLKSSYSMFIGQLKEKEIPTADLNDIPECERLGYCREKILFTSSLERNQEC
ncbi:hypothetical protein AVEN_115253-1 [Araneus ventricosus]|uniref:Caspase family p20 domain-containing protein n=1 Tax=Araneus ventricosus TaxID=182803 RepID=A0A4Y1ZZ11_ARAVE|nr:hypothetical protein AVEN_115253-1 [Araneus ventricosus]